MALGARKLRFYVTVLVTGFLLGGYLAATLNAFLPEGPAKEFFGFTVEGSFGPLSVDLLVVNMTLGPFGLNVSLLAIVGVILAYFLARSLF